MNYWAIGDVHGEADMLEDLIAVLPLYPEDGLVFLGDLVDRGPDTAGVLEQVLRLSDEREVILLRGNHEHMMLAARRDRVALPGWLAVGGEATLDAYRARDFDDIPPEHWQLLEQSRFFLETPDAIYVHANLDDDMPLQAQTEHDLLWRFYERPIRHRSGKFVVCGHTTQASGYPRLDERSICMDTLNPPNARWLTALNLERRCFWQVDHNGRQRNDVFASL